MDLSKYDGHTPGDWYDDGYRIYGPTDKADKREGWLIVEYKHVGDFNRADAVLMTDAPLLLAELRRVTAEGDALRAAVEKAVCLLKDNDERAAAVCLNHALGNPEGE